jgi:putative iron-only hydrogenase system regulator
MTDGKGSGIKYLRVYCTYTSLLPLRHGGIFVASAFRSEGMILTERREVKMNRIAFIGLMVEDISSAARINEILHDNWQYIIGRFGLPHAREELSVIGVVLDAPADVISAISGKLGALHGVSSKTIYRKDEQ